MCGNRNLDLVFQLAPSPIGDAYVAASRREQPQESFPIDLYLCRDCGLAQLRDVIAPEILYGDYLYVTSSSMGLAEHFREYAEEVLEKVRPRGALVVDIGSNDGILLRFFQQKGLRVLGIEPAQHIARDANAAGIETLPEFFTPALAEQVRAKYGPAAIITANNVFANIDDLTTMATGVRKLLDADGVFIFESYYLADLVRNMVFDFIYHEHLSSFSVKPVQSFFARMGMELIDVTRVPTKGGSLRFTTQLAGGPRRVQPSVAAHIQLENEMGLYQAETYAAFAAKVDGLKRRTCELLSELKSQGKSIAGFGASVTGTTLIYHFGLGRFLDYLVDDNPAKQGTYSPGLHLPVLPSAALQERKPDCVLMLAWRFAAPIIKKNQAYLDQGGRFIVPVPEVKTIQGRS
jgi:hypothetical protein